MLTPRLTPTDSDVIVPGWAFCVSGVSKPPPPQILICSHPETSRPIARAALLTLAGTGLLGVLPKCRTDLGAGAREAALLTGSSVMLRGSPPHGEYSEALSGRKCNANSAPRSSLQAIDLLTVV